MATKDLVGLPNSAALEVGAHEEQDFFGLPPLIPGEDPAAYGSLLRRVSAAVQPRDVLEEIWVRDVVDLVWEALRLRRLKANLLQVVARKEIPEIDPLAGFERSEVFVGQTSARRRRSYDRGQPDDDAMMALALDRKLDKVERIDRLIASAEARRNNALREIDRHRAAFGAALRQAVEKAEDAEFTDVETGQAASSPQ